MKREDDIPPRLAALLAVKQYAVNQIDAPHTSAKFKDHWGAVMRAVDDPGFDLQTLRRLLTARLDFKKYLDHAERRIWATAFELTRLDA